jgi:hypothetical protein
MSRDFNPGRDLVIEDRDALAIDGNGHSNRHTNDFAHLV